MHRKDLIFLLLVLLTASIQSKGQDKSDLLLRAEHTLAEGDTIMATEQFREVLLAYPQSFTAAMRLAEIYYDRKDYHTAIQYCNIALDINDNFTAKTEEGLLPSHSPTSSAWQQGKDKLAQYTSDRAYIHHLKGQIRTRQLRRADAIEEFQEALKLRIDSETLIDLALLYLETGHLQDALALLHQAKNLTPEHYKVYFNLANVHYKIQELDRALFYYQIVESKKPTLKWPYLYAGLIYTQKEQYPKAIEQYTTFLSIDSASEEVYFRRAVLYSELRQWDKALSDWTKVLTVNPENAEAWRNKGLSYFQSAQYDSAIVAFNEALKLLPDESYTYINRGYSYYLTNHPDQALADLNKGLEGLPKYYLGYYFRALVHWQMKNRKEACNDIHKALKLGMKESEIDEKLLKKCL